MTEEEFMAKWGPIVESVGRPLSELFKDVQDLTQETLEVYKWTNYVTPRD